MEKLLIDRKLMERLQERLDPHRDAVDWGMVCDALRAQPIQGGEAVESQKAQPEVAENTGSRSMENQLSSQGCTGCTGVEGAATPYETPDAVDIFAWATFDGEGSYDLRLYENNEGYRDSFRALNPNTHPDWVFPLHTHPAAQVADGVVVSRELLERIIKRGMRLPDETQHQHLEELRTLLAKSEGVKK